MTFRFGDAIPIQQQELLRDLRSDWEKKNPPPRTRHQWEQLNQLVGRESEKWLDVGFGECWMRQPEIRELVANALGYFDLGNETERLSRYELGAFVLMPNHLHLLVRPFCLEVEGDGFPGFETALSHVTHSWKRFTSRKINKLTGGVGSDLWFQESHDRIVRHAEHLWNALQYIGKNPRAAGLGEDQAMRWVRPSWQEMGWDFVDSTDEVE